MPLPSGRPKISNETPGPALAILALCSAGASALVTGSAIAYQWKHRDLVRGSKLDLQWNILLTFALSLCIAQSAVTANQVGHGLGYPIRMLGPDDVTKFLKLEYASNLLYIGSLLLLKAVQFVLQIAATFPKPKYWAPSIVVVGMLGFFLVAAFECISPFWRLRGNQCLDQTAFWIAFGIFDIVSDIYSVSVVIWVSASLTLPMPYKIRLLIILATRFLPAACAIARLPFIHTAYTSSNYTIDLYKLGMATQLQLHLYVVTLSLGKIFRFLNLLDVGYLSSAIEPTHGKGSVNQSCAGAYNDNSKLSNHSAGRHKAKPSISDYDSSKNLVPEGYGQTITEVEGVITMQRMNGPPLKQRSRSQKSRDVEERQPVGNVIRVTRQYEIRSEGAVKDGAREDGYEGRRN